MSRIGKKPVVIANGVKINHSDNKLEVTGPKGSLSLEVTGDILVAVENNEVTFTRKDNVAKNRALHGLYRALLQNMVTGVTDGFTKKLDLVGIGYRAELKGNTLVMMLGFSHPIVFNAPEGIKIELPTATSVVISGVDKQLVGQVAAKIRSFRLPEPYKGKGIKYDNEVIRRKAGKTASK
ncbi:MAG: 50S ribosomal protein L6 [Ignavibacteria bacterium]|nr:50S ribosomal protein L6 [Ignavibacteria bacterium]